MKNTTIAEPKSESITLMMKKENALDIISGKKKIEIRDVCSHYMRIFLDKEKDDGSMRAFKVLHFTNYNRSWSLEVKVKSGGYCYIDKKTIEEFQELYNFHDLDADAEKYDNLPEDEKPMIFWFELGEIIKQINISLVSH